MQIKQPIFTTSMPSHAAMLLEQEYNIVCNTISDIHVHVPVLASLANDCEHVTEMGVRTGASTRGILVSKANTVRLYDLVIDPYVNHLVSLARSMGKDVIYSEANVLKIEIEPTDLLFIDTDHTYEQLSAELALHGNKARKYLAFHDTDEPYGIRLMPAILQFLAANPHWRVKSHSMECHGFTVLERIG